MFRSAVDMSRLAPFVDAAASIDRTAWPNLFISYYTYGQAIGLGLDLSLRDRSNGKVTGDEYMRALWAQFGRPGQKEPGKVGHAVHDRRAEGDAGQGVRRSRHSPTISSRSTSKAASWWTTRGCWRAPAWCCASGPPAARLPAR